jgi:hypothetical protein
MANTYTWDFPALDTAPSEDGLSDVIKTIHWRITAVSDDNEITVIFSIWHSRCWRS